MSHDFIGQSVLITGSTSGIGHAAAQQFASRGAHVIVSGRDKTRGDAVVTKIRESGGQADFVAAELGQIGGVRALAAETTRLVGHVDVLVNNAGLFPMGPTTQVTVDDFDAVFDVNVRAPYFLVAELAPRMAERGGGAIVNVSTMVANFGASGMSLYGSSKAAMQLLTKAWAAEFGPSGVRVNAVSPGPTDTEGTAGMQDMLNEMAAALPSRKVGTPADIANAIVFLASPAASQIHGAVLPVDGGRIAV
ncbi:SDR family NAD(P)-dependent oxidoreductase [Mycobacterium sherrisii]|uniref:SDR family NAD(P)-dependent oxidoreductase n=1 Tax=Mycobacterium sherrisii TaxID=243061 RepID=UPI000A7E6D99|nr:SDR family oxidoreductase [Mycobacterium sherrisii]